MKKRHTRCHEETWWVESRRTEGSTRKDYKRRKIVLIGREWAKFVERLLTVRNIGYRHGH